ncbi:MAG TPA: hypothetical protein VK541_17425 [Pedobacter sp.]|uniref:hypothetical protein n=1 Tax=Pedobacter sp. TaxID=1411316 RepID=UPI002C211669|nr:hypothetical protein [Pedobacter sp.]HMI04273.1 hypothetical protein [Pedobacter sp.]
MRTDLLLEENFDLIDNGTEWAESASDQQHVQLLMILNKGELKEFPFVGFGAERRLLAIFDKNRITRDIKVELENDGYSGATVDTGNRLEDLKIEI